MGNLFYGNLDALDLQKMREDALRRVARGEVMTLHHHGHGMTCNDKCEVFDGDDKSKSSD